MPDPLTLGLLIVVPLAFYFLLIRPQSKRQKEQQHMLSTLEPGTTVLLASGIVAKVVEVGDQQLLVELAPGLEATVLKQVVVSAGATDEFDADEPSDEAADDDVDSPDAAVVDAPADDTPTTETPADTDEAPTTTKE